MDYAGFEVEVIKEAKGSLGNGWEVFKLVGRVDGICRKTSK
jgi:hypothetical protein